MTAWTLNGITATYTAESHTLSYQGASTEYYFYTAADLSEAEGATKIVVATDDTETAFDMGNTDHGAIDLVISDSKVTAAGNDNSAGFVTGKVTIGAGSTLELTGHDALGYNSTATTAIEMQGEANNKAVLDNKDTGKLTLTTNLTLKGNTEVKGSDIKVFGTKVTATGTDNSISNNLSLDNALTVEVTGADDTLLLTGNISGGKVGYRTTAVNGRYIRGFGVPNFKSKANESTPTAPAPKVTPIKTSLPELKRGSRGAYVEAMQSALLYLGYTSLGSADGDFGAKTEKAVINFQNKHNLVPDGICGPVTWQALLKALPIIKKGMKNNAVKALQIILKAKGYTDDSGKVLDIDGSFGAKTRQAVIKMQKANGLEPDGEVGPLTKAKF